MDMQNILDNAVRGMRDETLKKSKQITIGELLAYLGGVKNKSAKVYFDFDNCYPMGLSSWRGSYAEISFDYSNSEQAPTVENVISELSESIGKTYQGYKGGDFVMGRRTPIWVAHWGVSGEAGVVGIEDNGDSVIIKTEVCEY